MSDTAYDASAFWKTNIEQDDPELFGSFRLEMDRQQNQIELIASENIASPAVISAMATVFNNKYAEGYPGRRYYGGCEFVDIAERLAIERACKLFDCTFANVQPHSGAQANQSVFMALLKPGDTIMGMSLDAGGHLTHGAPPNQSGKWFNAIQYGVRREDALIDFDQVEALAREHKPKLIVAGGSAYPRIIDFERFRKICDEVGAIFMVDMAHFAGLVAAGIHPNPLEWADIVTSTTHKTLRCSRGGLILTRDAAIGKKINSAVFPGLQGGPLMHAIAGKAAGFGEALKPGFKDYSRQVVANAQALSDQLLKRGFDIVSGGTDTHLMLVDLRPKGVTGRDAEVTLENAHMTCNKNGIPFDPEKPTVTSGIRLGTPAGTTRGFKEAEFRLVGDLIADVLEAYAKSNGDNSTAEAIAREKVTELCGRFPIYTQGL